jgi:hypothetical protein
MEGAKKVEVSFNDNARVTGGNHNCQQVARGVRDVTKQRQLAKRVFSQGAVVING